MRWTLFCLSLVVACAALVPAGAAAQSALVDLSTPQSGKSRFVLKPDMTPADLGRVEEESLPVAAASRVPGCGEGCRMQQPTVHREPFAGGRDTPTSQRSQSDARVIVIGNVSNNRPQPAARQRAVVVNAYTRKDGTVVSAHTRSAPSSGRIRRR